MRSDINCDKYNVFIDETFTNLDISEYRNLITFTKKLPSIQLSELVSAAEDVHLIDNDTNNENIYEKSVTDYMAGLITTILWRLLNVVNVNNF